jgi:hypothetical protein
LRRRGAGEDVRLLPQPPEDARAALDDGAYFQPQPSTQDAFEWRTGAEQTVRALVLELHQVAHAEIAGAVLEVCLGDPVGGHLVRRDIDAPVLGVILVQVLVKVDQLQRRTDCIGTGEIPGAGRVLQVQKEAADRVGRAPAVGHHLAEVRVPGLFQILDEGIGEIDQRFAGEFEAPGGVGKCPPLGLRLPGRVSQ